MYTAVQAYTFKDVALFFLTMAFAQIWSWKDASHARSSNIAAL